MKQNATSEPDARCVTRRGALGLLAGSLFAAACGGERASEASALAGAPSGGGGGGHAGASGGTAGTTSGGAAGAQPSGLECSQSGPTAGCKITDDDILGPYYKADAPFRSDITAGATGSTLVVRGTVRGCDCATPLAGAIVDVWQANDAGEYDNTGFTLRGRVVTDDQGRYEVRTILPGLYLNGATYRPRHIHYKVSHQDGVALTTQLYFEGDPYIATDPFAKASLVMPVTETPAADGGKELHVTFDIVLG